MEMQNFVQVGTLATYQESSLYKEASSFHARSEIISNCPKETEW